MADARRWTDGLGRTRWQPVLEDGRGRWYEPGSWVGWPAAPTYIDRPSLHRFRAWARFLARQHERSEARHTWHPDTDEVTGRADDEPCYHESVDTFASGAGRRVDVCMSCERAVRFWNASEGPA